MDVERLAAWFSHAGIPSTAPLRPTLIAGGRSNLTYRIDDAAGRTYVLRRPPHAGVLQSAHDVAREHRIIAALANTDVPVPTVYGLCVDPDVLGAPFYVMNFVEGTVLAGDEEGLRYPEAIRAVASADLVDVLTRVHLLDPDAVGLGRLSKRQNYVERQLRRWHRQFHSTKRDLPVIDEVHRRLSSHIPAQRYTGLVHGDFRFGNVLVDDSGSVRAVLDWELATLGDTLADLGWMLATWREPGESEVLPSPTRHPGFLRRAEVRARYGTLTGRDVSALDYYLAFSLWRLSCISEGIYQRYLSGAMGDENFDVDWQRDQVSTLAEAAAVALDQAE